MEVGSKVIFLFRDAEGFGSSITDALIPNPNSSPLKRTETQFELPLEKYGIKGCNASGDIVHFVDHQGSYQVSVLLMQSYDPPVVACAINEVLASITGEDRSTKPTIVLPFFASESKLSNDMFNISSSNKKIALYGTHLGPETEFTQAIIGGTKKPLSSLQIQFEPLACLIHFICVLNLPTVLLIGPRREHPTRRSTDEQLEVLHEMGKFLASHVGLDFSKEKVQFKPMKKTKESEEPWRALYG
ncbi:hypothetical protein GIB67_013483 [Kingdonia uniflora]|uniref:DUF7894 domain-containing protein n=1 Tax=Kingdonia uniflora TaxID=39325 RepID=A0A7J7LRF8_9MAGN|nr:hypothetical protein GIB67_013483 [Kingdonia uniflora]